MIDLLGSPRSLCDGLSRRDFLRLGSVGALGLADYLAAPRQAQAAPATRSGQAKACILLFLYGSPPQHETFDPKPDAPAEVRGEMGSIASAVPGVRICEELPRVARILDKVTVVRSLTHAYPQHGVAYAVSGLPTYTTDLEIRPRDSRHWPYIGSVVQYLDERRAHGRLPAVPRNIALPWMLNSKTDILVNAGPFAAFLGQAYDPLWTDFTGAGIRTVPRYTSGQQRDFLDPFGGTAPSGRFPACLRQSPARRHSRRAPQRPRVAAGPVRGRSAPARSPDRRAVGRASAAARLRPLDLGRGA